MSYSETSFGTCSSSRYHFCSSLMTSGENQGPIFEKTFYVAEVTEEQQIGKICNRISLLNVVQWEVLNALGFADFNIRLIFLIMTIV